MITARPSWIPPSPAGSCGMPDMGWFITAIQQQGRPELTRELLVERRDAFLTRALEELQS